jgi:hypothetical protein
MQPDVWLASSEVRRVRSDLIGILGIGKSTRCVGIKTAVAVRLAVGSLSSIAATAIPRLRRLRERGSRSPHLARAGAKSFRRAPLLVSRGLVIRCGLLAWSGLRVSPVPDCAGFPGTPPRQARARAGLFHKLQPSRHPSAHAALPRADGHRLRRPPSRRHRMRSGALCARGRGPDEAFAGRGAGAFELLHDRYSRALPAYPDKLTPIAKINSIKLNYLQLRKNQFGQTTRT